jgi:solute carrier family 35 (UDP-sugar transporter), member A1/2/3
MAEHNALLRYGSLGVLVAQDTALVLLLRSSRDSHSEGPMYLASTAVLMMEIIKLICCCLMILNGVGRGSINRLIHVISFEVLVPVEMVKLSVPACLYLVQNNLLYFALSHLRATPYKVTYNLKIITGAFFSVTMLGQKLGFRKWVSLAALMVGVSIVQLNKHEAVTAETDPHTDADPAEAIEKLQAQEDPQGQFLGFLAVFAAAVTSGFCGVYQQRILQRSGGNIWVRNAQMGLSSCIFGIGSVLIKDIDAVIEHGFFQGYSKLVRKKNKAKRERERKPTCLLCCALLILILFVSVSFLLFFKPLPRFVFILKIIMKGLGCHILASIWRSKCRVHPQICRQHSERVRSCLLYHRKLFG